MSALSTSYMGVALRSPIIVGASGLTANMESIRRIEEMGAGAIVTKSLFEEQIQLDKFQFDETLERFDFKNAEMITTHPNIEHAGPAQHLMWVREAKRAVNIPVFASLNAVTAMTWIEYAKRLEDQGVDGLECNFFASPLDAETTGASVEDEQVALVAALKQAVSIPLAVKLSVFYSHPLNAIHRMAEAGAAGFVLFNRLVEPDIDIAREVLTAPFNMSHDTDYRLSLRYAGLLEGVLAADVCCSTGIASGEHVVKMLLAGASAVQTVGALYRFGIGHIDVMLSEIQAWMKKKGYATLSDFRGKLSKRNVQDTWAYTRAHYARLLMNPKLALTDRQTL